MLFHKEKIKHIHNLLKGQTMLIALQGPPQTGKTRVIKELSSLEETILINANPLTRKIDSYEILEIEIAKKYKQEIKPENILLFDCDELSDNLLDELLKRKIKVVTASHSQNFENRSVEIIKFSTLTYSEAIHFFPNSWIDPYNNYLRVGGMPEAIDFIVKHKEESIWKLEDELKEIHLTIVQKIYLSLMSSPINKRPHSLMNLLNSVLSDESHVKGRNKRFRYNNSLEGKRSFNEIFSYVERLEKLGLVKRIQLQGSLNFKSKKNMFKLLPIDTGIYSSCNDIGIDTIKRGELTTLYEIFFINEFGDSLPTLESWHENSSTLSFILKINDNKYIPVDIRNPAKTKSKALDQFIRRYSPKSSLLFTTRKSKENEVKGISLHEIGAIKDVIKEQFINLV